FPSKSPQIIERHRLCLGNSSSSNLGKTLALAAIHDVLIDLKTIVWFAHLCYVKLAPPIFLRLPITRSLFAFTTTPSFDPSAQSPPLGTATIAHLKILPVPKSPATFNRGLIQVVLP
ncbi:hypothetical protein N7519_004586, partial [Penicillium mononematosum]|uniref:uncharacterized protein n=1 Tax=Penicillium mononematosum TaxID=268346 RepID=UPI0025468914